MCFTDADKAKYLAQYTATAYYTPGETDKKRAFWAARHVLLKNGVPLPAVPEPIPAPPVKPAPVAKPKPKAKRARKSRAKPKKS